MLSETNIATTSSGDNQAYSAWLYCQASAAGCEPERVQSTIGGQSIWKPQPGPQAEAYNSEAEIIGYGGAAGGGKSFLALGLAATKHHRSIIFRRVFPSLGGLIDDSQKILTRKGDNYNGSSHIWKTADNRVIQFGQVQYKTDQKKHQGQPRDFMCVGYGTLVKMADGSLRPIQDIEVGDCVMTLEGSKRVTKLIPVRRDLAVRLTVFNSLGQQIASQVQSRNHSLLTSAGWVSYDRLSETRQPYFSSPMEKNSSRKFYGLSEGKRLNDEQPLAYRIADQRRSLESRQAPLDYQYLSEISAYAGQSIRGSDSAKFDGEHLDVQPRLLWNDHQGLHSRRFLTFSPFASQLPVLHVMPGERVWSSPEDSQASCLSGTRQCGEPPPIFPNPNPGQAVFLRCLHQSSDAEQPTPNDSVGDGQGKTPRCSHPTSWYDHPYTKETRRIQGRVGFYKASYSPIGKIDLYDLEIEEVNHYITDGGIVNKNCFDEATEFPESVVRFLMGWNRTTVPGQRCRVVLTFNPPMDDVGDWVTQFFGPWLDEASPNPAEDGELRWYARVEDRDFPIKEDELRWFIADGDSLVEVADDAPIKQDRHLMTPMRGVWVNGVAYLAKSRTFFHASLKDNPILAATGYGATVDALPEPLRSLLKGQFHAGRIADPWQVIPSDWIKIANERWKQREVESGVGLLPGKLRCDTLGVDVARGGRDATVIARRYGTWFAPLIKVPGTATPNGPSVAALVMNYLDKPANKHDAGPAVHIDAIGVGTSPFDILEASSVNVIPVVASEGSKGFDKSGRLKFRNLRAEMYWRLRESLDPTNGDGLALPPDPELLADLSAPRWSLSTSGILIESKADIFERIGRSPDCGDAVVMANWSGIPKPIAASPPVMMSRSSWNGSGDYEDEE